MQVQFLRGTALEPVPPKAPKHEGMRYLDIREGDDLDENRLRSWIDQASRLPGQKM